MDGEHERNLTSNGEADSRSFPTTFPCFPRIHRTNVPNAVAEALRSLRTSLLVSKPDGQPKVILVSSASAGEGKTTVAINLAMVLALRGEVCLVDADFRRPMVANAFGLRCSTGLSDVLTGNESLERVLISAPNIPGLTVLPGVVATSNPADLIASDNLKTANTLNDVIAALKHHYDFVVLDSPPMIPFSDARQLAPLSDAVVLVGRYGRTTRTALTRCAQLLTGVHAPAVGVVLNDIDMDSPDYHYYNYGFSRHQRYDPYEAYAQNYSPLPARNTKGPENNSRGAHA
jgi:capsular exopolysaccharide synthesis family protein